MVIKVMLLLLYKILEASLRQLPHCKYNNYIKHWLDYSKTMGKIEVTYVLDFLSAMFENMLIQPPIVQYVL